MSDRGHSPPSSKNPTRERRRIAYKISIGSDAVYAAEEYLRTRATLWMFIRKDLLISRNDSLEILCISKRIIDLSLPTIKYAVWNDVNVFSW
ncbi:hypothetical protein K1719_020784 [Acacia pycnantha]|nr:hypothetical protein K1719_020784 [Acacia pycnantha]